MDSSKWSPEQPVDLTERITRTSNYPTVAGGYGNIWRCILQDGEGQIVVAVKSIMFQDERELRRELGTWKRLCHLNILPLLGIASGFGPSPSMVSRWLENGSLTSYLSKHKDITLFDRLRLLDDVTSGLHYLHGVWVVHGDLTPNNVLLDDQKRAILTDFGLSSTLVDQGCSFTQRSCVKPGALRYAAPELLSDSAVMKPNIRSDVYSFGCLALHVLSGHKPWADVKKDYSIIPKVTGGCRPQKPVEISHAHWGLIERCLLSLDAPTPRPSTDEILTFIKKELRVEGKKSSTSIIPSSGYSDGNQASAPFQDNVDARGASSQKEATNNIIIAADSLKVVQDLASPPGGLGKTSQCVWLKKKVVVKSIYVRNATEESIGMARNAILAEVKHWMTLQHQNILRVAGTTTGFGSSIPSLVLPWMENGSLTNYLSNHKPSISEGRKLLSEVAAGLQYLHREHIIHGNLSSNNVLIDDTRTICLADYGLSSVMSICDDLYHPGALRWTAPELINGDEDKVSYNSDIYSFGCVAIHVLSGKLPYWWLDDLLQVLYERHKDQDPLGTGTVIDKRHDAFVRRCLSTSPINRPTIEWIRTSIAG